MAEEEKLDASKDMSFWDHQEALRHGLFRVVIALLAAFVVLFFFKYFLFDKIILAPTRSDFFFYEWFGMKTGLQLVVNLPIESVGDFCYCLAEVPCLYGDVEDLLRLYGLRDVGELSVGDVGDVDFPLVLVPVGASALSFLLSVDAEDFLVFLVEQFYSRDAYVGRVRVVAVEVAHDDGCIVFGECYCAIVAAYCVFEFCEFALLDFIVGCAD